MHISFQVFLHVIIPITKSPVCCERMGLYEMGRREKNMARKIFKVIIDTGDDEDMEEELYRSLKSVISVIDDPSFNLTRATDGMLHIDRFAIMLILGKARLITSEYEQTHGVPDNLNLFTRKL
jgi:hypothetical protein